MPNSDLFVPKLSLAYAKIVATPTETGWSQVYNAGSLFAVLSLTINDQGNKEISLPAAGKNLFNNLEAEFFTLEKKTLTSIKTAIEKSFENIPPNIIADACFAFFKDKYLYLFIIGRGKIIMKRDEKIGTLLERQEDRAQLIHTASGILQQDDIIILQTEHFAQNVSDENIAAALELQLPSDIAENLSPHVHKKEDANQAAIIIAYNGTTKTILPDEDLKDSIKESSSRQAEQDEAFASVIPAKGGTDWHLPKVGVQIHKRVEAKVMSRLLRLTRLQKILLCIGTLILLLLIASIIFTKQKQEDTKYQQLYQTIYEPAQKKYEEGKALKKLNQSLAQDDLQKAEKLLEDNISKFKQGSKEQSSLKALLDQVQAELKDDVSSSSVKKTTPGPADVEDNNILSIEKSTPALAYSQDENAIYIITSKAISTIDKKTGAKKEIITNDKDWTNPIAIVPYQKNIYVLERQAGILKFVPSSDGYGKTQYFKGTAPDLSNAQSMAIDGSIWILGSDGQILKYTKGEKESFALSGLDHPLASPTKIVTNIDSDSLYILDKNNARIVKVAKSGTYQNAINADLLQQATDFEILEKEQKINFLSDKKIYSLPLE
jgi:hypothetical protein